MYLWPGETDIADAPAGTRVSTVRSPSHTLALKVTDDALAVIDASGKAASKPLEIEDLAEVNWAPDSREFAVTQSDGGWVGTWTVTAYAVTPDGLHSYELSKLVAAKFQARKGGCAEIPNVGAGGWLGPGRLLVIAEAPPHSSCSDMGSIRGYEVAVEHAQILDEYDAPALKSRFGRLLGRRFGSSP
ncbi:hypothetical protein GCM10007863_25570 [Dyella mobilis]|nr:hypothetical protein GCM10007863_25570 [Dyella mobilis]